MSKVKKGVLHKTFAAARKSAKAGEDDKARDLFDFMILKLANERWDNDAQVNDEIEGVRIGIWLERAWYGLENNNLLL
jgi:hypothetical protein|tara:strand:- start:1083 stop:1316 length:234 start_codon:yes stop_codon:yes gene_type:complete